MIYMVPVWVVWQVAVGRIRVGWCVAKTQFWVFWHPTSATIWQTWQVAGVRIGVGWFVAKAPFWVFWHPPVPRCG